MADEAKATEATEANEKKETISYTFVQVRPFPEFDGPRTVDGPRSKIASPGFFKPEMALPIPQTDEEAEAMYGQTRDQLLAKGVRQHYYDVDQIVIAWFNERVSEKKDLDVLEEIPPNSLFIKVPTERKASDARKAKDIQAKTGKSMDEIDAILTDPAAAKQYLADLEKQASGKGKGKKKAA